MRNHPAVEAYARHVSPGLVRLLGVLGYGRLFVRASGESLFDSEGREYLDALAGFGAVNVGHHHPRVAAAIRRAAARGPLGGGKASSADALALDLCRRAGPSFGSAIFSSSGAEAVEIALKIARAATGRPGVVYCARGYHGLNTASLSLASEPRMRRPFEPLFERCEAVPYGSTEALSRALADHRAAAFVVEPVQCEGGLVFPPEGYLARAAALCREAGTLLVLDEVQTGLGRTGRFFALEHEGLVGDLAPDVLVLAKALGGSLASIGASLCSPIVIERALARCPEADLAGGSQAASAVSCEAALETLSVIDDEGLCERSSEVGALLKSELVRRLSGHPLVREVRGRGLLVGVELGGDERLMLGRAAPQLLEAFSRGVLGHWVAVRLLERGVVCQPTLHQPNVLRLEPPLTLRPDGALSLARAVGEVLDEGRDVGRLAGQIARRLARQALTGWSFLAMAHEPAPSGSPDLPPEAPDALATPDGAGSPDAAPSPAPGGPPPPRPWWRRPLMVTTVIACVLHLPFTPAVPFLRMLERLSILRDNDKSWDYQQADVSLPIELVELNKPEPAAPPTEDNAVALPAAPPPNAPPHAAPAPTADKAPPRADKSKGDKGDDEAKRAAEQAKKDEKAKKKEAAKAEKAELAKADKKGEVKFAQGQGDDDEKPADGDAAEGAGEKTGDAPSPPKEAKKVAEQKPPKGPDVVGLKGKLSEGLVGKPNVTVALWMPEIRAHALGSAVGDLMSCSPDWKPFLQKGIRPLDDIEGFMAVGPQIASSAKMTVAVQHKLGGDQVKAAIDALVQRSGKAGGWIGDDAARIVVQKRERVIFPHPRDMVFVAPTDGWEAIHNMKDPVSLPPPKGRAVSVTLLKPARPMRKLGLRLPDRLAEMRLDVFANHDGSVDLRLDFDDESEAAAAADVEAVGKTLEQFFGDLSQVAETVTSLAPGGGAEGGRLSLPRPDFSQVGKRLTATVRVLPAQSGKMLGILGKVVCPKKPAQAPPQPAPSASN